MTAMELARQERADLLELLSSLPLEQWEQPTLCDGWTVRDVVAHVLSYDDLTAGQTLHRFISGRLSTARINATVLAEFDGTSPEQLLQRLSTHLRPAGLPAGMGGRIGLTDALIHHQDIRRPLGLHRSIAHERLRVALPTAIFAPVVQGIRRVYDVRLVATDMEWQFGRGPELKGTAEALLMTVAGRTATLDELEGSGKSRILDRVSG
ncbi:TIGR03083 family protein [Quadrisphaera granulorum]|uniref:Uncharacterized protein (TIGR03083 family) n=1 Tax=Quadrisphaera granulorum TaxID=317664 RepID=A0A316A4B3_9ACTN|nr:maleylpyruvate isomerase family mycothiol-dependent enzyme [Quadrisphaera granulorum]PWJ52515.1 uncharacterized protein (TIGR03083 family) [Quadrisphaera granulorum]SZE97565.1 TIGR03083 family protein [Quadrisphaera granulorum]